MASPSSSRGVVPSVSRKVRACTACQKQKIKCIVEHGSRVCNRCHQNHINCVFNRNLQTILDEDSRWKSGLQQSQARLENITKDILAKLNMPDISTYDRNGRPTIPDNALSSIYATHPQGPATGLSSNSGGTISYHQPGNRTGHEISSVLPQSPSSPQQDEQSESHQNGSSVDDGVLVSEPMGSLYEVTKLNKFRSRAPQDERNSLRGNEILDDFISRGVVSFDEAEELLLIFTQSLNHYLWVGLDERHSSIELIRRSSPLLAASILTAMSMHIPNRTETYDKCYAEFLSLVSHSMFRHTHNLDDIRGLTIAAFWLSDLSWKLSGHAIRIATELELHRSFTKASHSADHHERARIWCMLYVCDHHFANAYGRPPMMHETQQIIEHEKLLESPFASSLDFRLLSQVSLFMILKRIYDDFDERTNIFLPEKTTLMHNYNIELDQWRLIWEARQKPNQYIGNFPSKGIVLYYHFAKLQLNALPLHQTPLNTPHPLSPPVKEFLNHASTAALNIITLLLDDSALRRALVGTPLYVHTMLTFACVFLFKLGTKWHDSGLLIDIKSLCALIERVIEALNKSQAGERHLIYRIAHGLETMLAQYREKQKGGNAMETVSQEQTQWDAARPDGVTLGGIGPVDDSWQDMGFLDEFGGGFGMGINQFLSTQVQFGYQT